MISWMPTQGLRRVQIALQLGQPRPFGRYPLCQLQQEMITRRKNRSHAQSLWQYPRFGNTRIVWSGKRVATGTTHKTLQGAKCAQCVGMHGWNKFLNWEITIWRLSRCQLFTISQIGSWGHRPSCTTRTPMTGTGDCMHAFWCMGGPLLLLHHHIIHTLPRGNPLSTLMPATDICTESREDGASYASLTGGLWCEDHTQHPGDTTIRLHEAYERLLSRPSCLEACGHCGVTCMTTI